MHADDPDTENLADGPVGQGDWTVQAGDSIDSIAATTGHFWQTIWNHPDNAGLKSARPSRTILMPGDKVTVPDLREKQESRPTDQTHRFVRKGVPAEIRFQILDPAGKPQANRPYVLRVGRRRYEGDTDADGMLHRFVSPDASDAVLFVHTNPDDDTEVSEWRLQIGRVWPPDTIEGMQSRLKNLGYYAGTVDGEFGDLSKNALSRFRADSDLPEGDAYDTDAQDALTTRHGS